MKLTSRTNRRSRTERDLAETAFREGLTTKLAELQALLLSQQAAHAESEAEQRHREAEQRQTLQATLQALTEALHRLEAEQRRHVQALGEAQAQIGELAAERHVAVAEHLRALSEISAKSFSDVATHLEAVDQRLLESQALTARIAELTTLLADLQSVLERNHAAQVRSDEAHAEFRELSAERHRAVAGHLDELGDVHTQTLNRLVTDVAALDVRLKATQALTSRVLENGLDWAEQVAELRTDPQYSVAFDEARPLISVYICTWNRAQLVVERALASVLRQTYDNWEAIVIGDACTDDTAERIAALRDPRIHFENLAVRGPYPELPGQLWQVGGTLGSHRAFQLAKGQWTAQLDDDDEWDDDHLEVLLAEAVRSRAEVVYGKWRWVDAKSNKGLGTFGSWPPRLTQIAMQAGIEHGGLRRFLYDPEAYLADEPGDWHRTRHLLAAGVRFAFLDREVSTIYIAAKTDEHQQALDNLVRKP